jgi:uncharacterized protein
MSNLVHVGYAPVGNPSLGSFSCLPPVSPARLRREVLLVLGLSLGASAVYAVVSLVADLTEGPLGESTVAMNTSQTPRPWLDLTYQLLGIGFDLVPVALALYLLTCVVRVGTDEPVWVRRTGADRIGLHWRHRDLLGGTALALLIGLPGLGFYYLGRAMGITAEVIPAALADHWWTIPVLILAALENALVEEVIVVGYLMTRLRELAWSPLAIIAASAVLRGSYHLYQGVGPFFGNVVMGIVFGLVFLNSRRVMPLVVAHTLLDVGAFVGYWVFLR